jgi:hypothetical protein
MSITRTLASDSLACSSAGLSRGWAAHAVAEKAAAVKAMSKAEVRFMGVDPDNKRKMARLWPDAKDMGTIF